MKQAEGIPCDYYNDMGQVGSTKCKAWSYCSRLFHFIDSAIEAKVFPLGLVFKNGQRGSSVANDRHREGMLTPPGIEREHAERSQAKRNASNERSRLNWYSDTLAESTMPKMNGELPLAPSYRAVLLSVNCNRQRTQRRDERATCLVWPIGRQPAFSMP
jgi:hypothetical protein